MIAAFTLLNLRNFTTTTPARMLFALLFVVVIGVTAPIQGAPIVCGAVVAAIFASYFFQADERGRLDVLYALSAASRTTVVIGRHLATLLLGVGISAVGLLVTLIATLLRHEAVNWPLVATMLLITYGILAVATAAQMPWFFAVGFTRGRPIIFVFIAVLVLFGWVEGSTDLLAGTGPATLATLPPASMVEIVLAAGAALLVLSAAVSRHLYLRRDL